MAKDTKKVETVDTGPAESGVKGAGTVTNTGSAEAVYTAQEFAQNAERLFGKKANSDLVTAAFKIEGKTEATLPEAKDIVARFMNKEVK